MNCGVTCCESDGAATETDSIREIYILLSSFYSHMYSSHICYHIDHNPCYTYCYSNTELRAMQHCADTSCAKSFCLYNLELICKLCLNIRIERESR